MSELNKRKKLLVIGAGDFQLPLVQKASETCDVFLAAPVISEAFYPYIKGRLLKDVRDEEAILTFAKDQGIDGVITDQTDIAVRSVAYVSEKMGLPGIGCETGILFTDKSLMRARLAELGIQSIPINALMPLKGTPLEDLPQLTEEDILRTVAFFRYINPTANVRLAAGRGLCEGDGRQAFCSGASATITGNMLTTSGSTIASDRKMLTSLGREVVTEYSDAKTNCGGH